VSVPGPEGESAEAARAALAAAPGPELARDGVPERLVLALDGIPYDLFAELQGQQLFADFRPVARMVAPFPSLSDVSFSAIGGNPPPTGYQVMRFDPQSNRVVGNTLGSLSSRAHSNLPSDSSEYSSWHRMFGYMASSHVAVRELKQIRSDLLASRKATFLAYVETSDAVLHVEGRAGAIRFLRQLDRFLVELQQDVRARTGRELLVDIVSDHGSTQMRGRNVDISGQLRSCGLKRSKALAGPQDVAYSFAGIIGFVAVSTQPGQVATVARCLSGTDGVELVAIERGDRVVVLSADGGEAEILPTPGAREESYRYRTLQGDPLRLLDAGAEPGTRDFPERALFKRTLDRIYPDPLRRLWRAFHGAVQEPSPILLSLADGRDAGFRTVRALAELRGRSGTHGAMTRMASLGVLTSNWRDVDDTDCWRAHEVLFGSATLAAMRLRSHGWISQRASSAPESAPAPASAPASASASTPVRASAPALPRAN
jgi:hypothetical protein